jgi:LmbE family N-acetylglucosaminyl deacetylase
MTPRLFRLPDEGGPKCWLFAFTHPDDEISICAWINRLTSAGAEVWCGWSVSNPTRESEARAVMKRLGVNQERLAFFTMPDGSACDHLSHLAGLWSDLIERSKPDVLALGAFECGHIDHDSTNFAVHQAISQMRREIAMLEVPFYHTYLTRIPILNRFADPTGEEVLTMTQQEQALKRDVSRCYRSQNIGSLLVWYTLLGWVRFRPPGLCRTERMRVQTHFDYSTPNLPEPLRSRVLQCRKWRRWVSAVQRAGK